MSLTPEFYDAAATIMERRASPLVLPWPMPGDLGGLLQFSVFSEWRNFMQKLSLVRGVPEVVEASFDRAHKLYVLAWVDFDLLKVGEQVALTTLELALRIHYGDKVIDKKEDIYFARTLNYMVEFDGLTDELIQLNRRCGPQSSVVGRLTGHVKPSLAQIRNDFAHGNSFSSLQNPGLLELVRDLIEYAFRDTTGTASVESTMSSVYALILVDGTAAIVSTEVPWRAAGHRPEFLGGRRGLAWQGPGRG